VGDDRGPNPGTRAPAKRTDYAHRECRVASVDELRVGLNALKARDADAYFYTNDAMISSQAQLIIDAARTKKLPTIFGQTEFAVKGALTSMV
jgi:ABC-type uncharacterized transport system substrate-binding protein